MPSRLPRTIASLAPLLAAACWLTALAGPVQARQLAEPSLPGAGESEAPRHSGRCTLTLQAPASPVASGTTVTLTGRLECPEPAAAEGRPVTIFERRRGAGLTEVTTVAAGAEGAFEATAPVTGNTVFIARSFRTQRARAAVEVGDAVTLAGPSGAAAALFTRGSYRHGARVARATFTGAVSPAAAGVRVALQRRYVSTGEPWHTIAYTRTDETGAFSFTRGFRSAGELSFRAVAHVRGHLRSYSPELTFTVAQGQNPQLTIAADKDPLPAGQSAMITGALSAGAGHAVELIARAAGHPPAPVAFVISGEGGAYSFTVAPTVNTTYRVIAGKTGSMPLFLGLLPALTLQPTPATATLGQPVSFAGTLTGAPTGAIVRLESELPGGQFTTVASGPAQAGGAFTLPYVFTRTGTRTLRVSTPRGQSTIGATSPTFTVAVQPSP